MFICMAMRLSDFSLRQHSNALLNSGPSKCVGCVNKHIKNKTKNKTKSKKIKNKKAERGRRNGNGSGSGGNSHWHHRPQKKVGVCCEERARQVILARRQHLLHEFNERPSIRKQWRKKKGLDSGGRRVIRVLKV